MSGFFEFVRWNACVHRLDLGLYSHPKEFLGNGVSTHVNAKGKLPSTGRRLEGGWSLRRCIRLDSEPNTLPTEPFRPHTTDLAFGIQLCDIKFVRRTSMHYHCTKGMSSANGF